MTTPAYRQPAPLTDPASRAFVEALSARLVASGVVDGLAVKRAERAQSQSGERFDLVLMRLGIVADHVLAETLARLLGRPLVVASAFPPQPLFAEVLRREYLRTARLLPVADDGRTVTLAMADPFDREAIAAIGFLLGREVAPAVAAEAELAAAIDRLYADEGPSPAADAGETALPDTAAASDEDVRRLRDLASEAPVIKLVHDLIARAAEQQASDIHIEPREASLHVRFRIDGMLHTVETLPPALRAAVTSRIKIMAELNIAERRLPQDGRIRATVRGREIDLRVSTMPTLIGESVVLRLLDRASLPLDFAALGLSAKPSSGLARLLCEPNGILLVTGPTGSGKTTTLYTAMDRLNRPELKTFTVEDPIEYRLQGVNQIQVQPRIGLTFAHALRSILRQDPDVVLVGEIRDLETAEVAVQASLTGHLVLSTLHTNSAPASVVRLLDMGLERFLLASSLKGVLAQRLVRCLCPECAARQDPSPIVREALAEAGLDPAAGIVRRPVGCPHCRNTGYRGRTMVSELLVMDDRVQDAVLAGGTERAVRDAAAAGGMGSMYDDGLTKVHAGITSLDEVLRVTRIERREGVVT